MDLNSIIDLILSMFSKHDPVPAAAIAQQNKEDLQNKRKSLHLKRLECKPEGIFSELFDVDGSHICFVAEHAYDSLPKLPNGTWTVELGTHTLDHGGPQSLFCVQGVPGHSGICFHKGNFPQTDSDGCLLLGTAFGGAVSGKVVIHSEVAFDAFMKKMSMVTVFSLLVD